MRSRFAFYDRAYDHVLGFFSQYTLLGSGLAQRQLGLICLRVVRASGAGRRPLGTALSVSTVDPAWLTQRLPWHELTRRCRGNRYTCVFGQDQLRAEECVLGCWQAQFERRPNQRS